MGGKKADILNFTTADGKNIDLPVGLIIGDAPGPEAVITAGIHGKEYCSIYAAQKLFCELSPSDIKGSLKIITVCDTATFETGESNSSPIDDLNLDRCFPGKLKGSYSFVLAARIFDEIKGADFHIDLHTSSSAEHTDSFALYHRGRCAQRNDKAHEIAYYSGEPNIVITEAEGRWQDGGTCYSNVYEMIGIPSTMLIYSVHGSDEAECISRCAGGITNVLRRFGLLKGAPAPVGRPQIYESMVEVRAHSKGVLYRSVTVGDVVRRGQLIGILADYFGKPLEKILSPINGKVMFMTRSPAIPKDGFVAAIGIGK